jgi:hypothetical protein
VGFCKPRFVPSDADLRRAADILNAGKKVAMLVGAGALEATDEVLQASDILGAGVSKAVLDKAVIPDDAPGCGAIGLLGTKPSWDMMMNCDTLLMIGSSFPYSEFLPKEGQARGVQIEIDGKMSSIRYPMEVPLVGDSAETLRALIPLLTRKKRFRSMRSRKSRHCDQQFKPSPKLLRRAEAPMSFLPEISPEEKEELFRLFGAAHYQIGLSPKEILNFQKQFRDRLRSIRDAIEPKPFPLVFDDFQQAAVQQFLDRLRKQDPGFAGRSFNPATAFAGTSMKPGPEYPNLDHDALARMLSGKSLFVARHKLRVDFSRPYARQELWKPRGKGIRVSPKLRSEAQLKL